MKFIKITNKFIWGTNITILPLTELIYIKYDKEPEHMEIKFRAFFANVGDVQFDIEKFEEFLKRESSCIFLIELDYTTET